MYLEDFPGDEPQLAALRQLRDGWAVAVVAERLQMAPEDVQGLYDRYIQWKLECRSDPRQVRRAQEKRLDDLEAVLARFTRGALAGDPAAARIVLATATTLATLEREYRRLEAMAQAAQSPPAQGDAQKAKDDAATADPLTAAYRELERVSAMYGRPVPSHVTRAYEQALRRRLGAHGVPPAGDA